MYYVEGISHDMGRTTLKYRVTATLILALVLLAASLGTAAAEESPAVIATGTIEALDADSLTVEGLTFDVNGDTSFVGPDGPLTFDDLEVGMPVTVLGVRTSDETLLAKWVVVLKPTPTPPPSPISTPVSPISTPTPEFCHPVARMIALFFDLTCAQVTELHDEGVGFGAIARAYLTAQALGEEVSPEAILALHRAGVGWGQIMRQFGAVAHPGGKGLGAIMRDKSGGKPPSPEDDGDDAGGATGAAPDRIRPGNSGNAPGHNKDDGPRSPDRGKGSDKPKGRPW